MRKAFKDEEDDAATDMKKGKKKGKGKKDETLQSADEDSKPKLGYVNEYGEFIEAEDDDDEREKEEVEEDPEVK